MKKLLISVSVLFCSLSVSSQISFEKSYQIPGNQTASSIIPISDSTYLMTYYSDSLNYLLKIDSQGDTVFSKSYPFTPNGERFSKIIKSIDDNFLILSSPSRLLKVNSIGDTIWYKLVGGNRSIDYFDFTEDNSGNIVLVGSQFIGTSICCSGYVIKLDSLGSEISGFNNTIFCPGSSGCLYKNIIVSRSGEYVIGGNSIGLGIPESRVIIIDSMGNLITSRKYTSWQPFQALIEVDCIVEESDGSFVFGSSDYNASLDSTYIIKTDSNGNFLWNRGYKGSSAKWQPKSIIKTQSGYFVAGQDDGNVLNTIQLLKLDRNYNFVWQKSLTMNRVTWLTDMNLTNDGGLVLTGNLSRPNTGNDIYYAKTDSNGVVTSLSPNLFQVSANNFLVSPNPTTGVVKIPYVEGVERVEVFDITGKLLQDFVMLSDSRSVNKIDISNYKNGIYLLKLHMKDGEMFTKKVIKE